MQFHLQKKDNFPASVTFFPTETLLKNEKYSIEDVFFKDVKERASFTPTGETTPPEEEDNEALEQLMKNNGDVEPPPPPPR